MYRKVYISKMTMSIIRFCPLVFCLYLVSTIIPCFAGTDHVTEGMVLPQITLGVPVDEGAKEYLGIKNKKTFSLTAIPCKLVILEIFSLYCPICHKQAPVMKSIHKYIQQDPELYRDIKVIGIGAGNNLKEVGTFKEHFKIFFPIFPDHDFSIHKKLGEPRTPTTIVVNRKGKVLYVHSGAIEEPDNFKQILHNLHDRQ